jgi:hypothetical protein
VPQVQLRNGCLPATPSALMEMCLEQSVDADVDLLFIEYVANDGANRCAAPVTNDRANNALPNARQSSSSWCAF